MRGAAFVSQAVKRIAQKSSHRTMSGGHDVKAPGVRKLTLNFCLLRQAVLILRECLQKVALEIGVGLCIGIGFGIFVRNYLQQEVQSWQDASMPSSTNK